MSWIAHAWSPYVVASKNVDFLIFLFIYSPCIFLLCGKTDLEQLIYPKRKKNLQCSEFFPISSFGHLGSRISRKGRKSSKFLLSVGVIFSVAPTNATPFLLHGFVVPRLLFPVSCNSAWLSHRRQRSVK